MHFRLDFLKDIFFTEDYVTEKQSDLGPQCLQYKLHKKLQEHQQPREADKKWLKWLNNGSLEEKS